jgi:hypothetical protein
MSERTDGMRMDSGLMKSDGKGGDRVPMGVRLPKENMNSGATRSKVGETPGTIGPRTA